MRYLTILIAAALVAFAAPAQAQTWHTANQVTLAWGAVTTLADGTAIPAADVVKYQVYKRLIPSTVYEAVGGEITATQQVVNFLAEGGYYLGVKALRYVDGKLVKESEIAWSDVAANCANGEAFGVTYWLAPSMIKNMRLQ
jgi:hypothetical protein